MNAQIEIEVDPHHVDGDSSSSAEGVNAPNNVLEIEPPAPMGWTSEQAGQFICSIWNIGCIIYGPNWAADPRETAGWDTYCAQLLDQVLPRGMGGAVELGVGLVMIGNGLAMMTMRRWPIIKAGPRPIWQREKVENEEAAPPTAPAPQVPSPPANQNGNYKFPETLAPRNVPENPNAPWLGV